MTYSSHTGSFATIQGQFLAGDIGYQVTTGTSAVDLKVVDTADLKTTKVDSADPVPVGQSFFYTITVKNLSTKPAAAVKLVDTLKPPLVFESVSTSKGTCTAAGTPTKVTCKLGTLAAGQTATITINVHGSAPGTVTNVASASSKTLDSNAANNKGKQKTTIQ